MTSYVIRAELTDRQAAVLACIENLTAERGYPPTLREIGDRLGFASTNGVSDHLAVLERKGYLQRDKSKARGMRSVSVVAP